MSQSNFVVHCASTIRDIYMKCNGSGVELRTLVYENPSSNPGCFGASFFHSTLLQFTQLNKYLAIDSGGYVYEQPSRINCSIWLDASHRSRDGV